MIFPMSGMYVSFYFMFFFVAVLYVLSLLFLLFAMFNTLLFPNKNYKRKYYNNLIKSTPPVEIALRLFLFPACVGYTIILNLVKKLKKGPPNAY